MAIIAAASGSAFEVGGGIGQRVRKPLKFADLAAERLTLAGIIGGILHRLHTGGRNLRGAEQPQFLARGAEQAGRVRIVDSRARANFQIAQPASRDRTVEARRSPLRQIVPDPQLIAIKPKHRPRHAARGQQLLRFLPQIRQGQRDHILPAARSGQPRARSRRQLRHQPPHHDRLDQRYANQIPSRLLGHDDGMHQAGIAFVRRAQRRNAERP